MSGETICPCELCTDECKPCTPECQEVCAFGGARDE